MVEVVKTIACPHCNAPLPVQAGEILVTCRYCGYTSVIETGKALEFEHSLVANVVKPEAVFELVRSWMTNSFSAPGDLAKKASLVDQSLIYLPLWVVVVEAKTHYRGVLERIPPPSEREGDVENRYDWLVLARRKTDFPTRSYHLSLGGKVPFDAMRIERGARILNSEFDADEAAAQAKDEIENLHTYLAMDKVDRVLDVKTSFDISGTFYLHAPVWFISYSYKEVRRKVILDGASGEVITGELPTGDFKLL